MSVRPLPAGGSRRPEPTSEVVIRPAEFSVWMDHANAAIEARGDLIRGEVSLLDGSREVQ